MIKEVNRVRVKTAEDLEQEIKRYKSGESVALLVVRSGVTFFVALTIP